jgi:adenylate cyclase
MPILDRRKQVVAVVQLLNKQSEQQFSEDDEQAFREFAAPLGLILESCIRMTQVRTMQ